jgi:4-hydroxy-tetrahydrodipicolinate reductase
MGQMLIETVRASDKARLVAVTERSGHAWVGQDLGVALGGTAIGVPVTDDPLEAFATAQAVIDFTSPEATLAHAELTAQARAVHVIGTTGFSAEQLAYFEHHRHKVDAPSGTALMLGEAAAEGRGVNLADVRDSGRDGITGARKIGDIGFSAIRGGDVVGEHDVIFAGEGERIVLRHLATDRAVFARGALRAALWGQDQKPGEYDMLDVLGLS